MTSETFTDEDLDSRRTTRKELDPLRDRADSIVAGDLILVDVSAYIYASSGQRLMWCEFAYSAPGSASVYPYKAHVPDRGIGQWRASEILAWATPLLKHRLRNEIAAAADRAYA